MKSWVHYALLACITSEVSYMETLGQNRSKFGGWTNTQMSKLPRGFWVGVSAQNFSPLLWHSHFVVVVVDDDDHINKRIF